MWYELKEDYIIHRGMKLIRMSPAFVRREKCRVDCTYKGGSILISFNKIRIIHFFVDSMLIWVLVQV